ncbi:hypothetical protein KP77_19610 [Jeotgalibacillus alimentarius]|uniref:Uncharacterized protein n=1 Tax=Jeotgalibacillus alimentarius TaxID=135826 RepID=A0A0C2W1U5_9BACL|nr:hypothetical protein [Jeotgalibacillus alimentarius]KIL50586.1 hypothetical protein KP77_19610 [Jeotgalibacillus alimentarius]
MNRRQWILLSTMSTMLMMSAVLIVLIILSDRNEELPDMPAQEQENTPEAENISEAEIDEEDDSTGSVAEEFSESNIDEGIADHEIEQNKEDQQPQENESSFKDQSQFETGITGPDMPSEPLVEDSFEN